LTHYLIKGLLAHMSLINLSAAQLRQAASLKEKIEQLHEQLVQLIDTPSSAPKQEIRRIR